MGYATAVLALILLAECARLPMPPPPSGVQQGPQARPGGGQPADAIALLIALHIVPDPRLTPGVASADPVDVVCVRGYSRAHRLFAHDRRRYWRLVHSVLQEYRVPWPDRRRYEIDDRVPLCLGGRQRMANLWPQVRQGVARQKDRLETAVRRRVCRSEMEIGEARRLFLSPSWIDAYCRLFGGCRRYAITNSVERQLADLADRAAAEGRVSGRRL